MSKVETGRALLRAFGDAARMIALGYDPRSLTQLSVIGGGRRSAVYQRGLLAAFATAYGK